MEKRQSNRIIAGYKTMITYGNKRSPGVIENLSEKGVNVITDLTAPPLDFSLGEAIDLRVDTPSGEQLNLSCTIKWARKVAPHNVRNLLGLEIINPPWERSGNFL